jgi:hypothetical protein
MRVVEKDGGESNVKKEQNGRKSPRRLKPTVGCNASKRRRKIYITLGFVSPCIIIYSNKSTNQMHQSLSFIACRLNTAQHVSGFLTPIISSLSTAVAASGLPLERGGSSVVGRGRS